MQDRIVVWIGIRPVASDARVIQGLGLGSDAAISWLVGQGARQPVGLPRAKEIQRGLG